MQAYKLAVTISEERTVQLPRDVPAGPAEVIVLFGAAEAPSAVEGPSRNAALFRLLETLQTSDHPRRSKEEIDAELAEERASWDDRR
jgi:hypothetical protein